MFVLIPCDATDPRRHGGCLHLNFHVDIKPSAIYKYPEQGAAWPLQRHACELAANQERAVCLHLSKLSHHCHGEAETAEKAGRWMDFGILWCFSILILFFRKITGIDFRSIILFENVALDGWRQQETVRIKRKFFFLFLFFYCSATDNVLLNFI